MVSHKYATKEITGRYYHQLVDIEGLRKNLISSVKWDLFNIDNMMQDKFSDELKEEFKKIDDIIANYIQPCPTCKKVANDYDDLHRLYDTLILDNVKLKSEIDTLKSNQSVDIKGLAFNLASRLMNHPQLLIRTTGHHDIKPENLLQSLIQQFFNRHLKPCQCEELLNNERETVRGQNVEILKLQSEIESLQAKLMRLSLAVEENSKLKAEMAEKDKEIILLKSISPVIKLKSELNKLTEYLTKKGWYDPDNENPVDCIIRITGNFIGQNKDYDEEIKYLKAEIGRYKKNYSEAQTKLGKLHSKYNELKKGGA